ncbi:MAG: YbfB/YjiJ family MFS transporter, partial [Pseudomonadota bacterium]
MGRPSPNRSWLILAGLALGICVSNGFARFSYGLILPAMQEDLSWTYTEAGWINTANAIGYVVGAILTFVLVGRASAALLFTVGMVGTSACLVANGLTESFWWLTVWRIWTGVFGAFVFIVGSTLAASLFQDDPNRNALAIAINFGGGGFGMVLSGATLPVLFASVGPQAWPLSWLGLGIASVLCCGLSIWAAYALQDDKAQHEGKRAGARLPVRRMLALLLGYGLFAAGYIVYLTFLIAWMHSLNFSAISISLTWLIVGVGMMVSPFVWRRILAHYDNGLPLALATGATAVGTIVPLIWPTVEGLVISAALFGLSVFIAPSAVTSFSRKNLPVQLWGPALGLFTIIFAVGQTIGPVAAGAVGDGLGDIRYGLLGAGLVLG